jgi:hypothetical protein
MAIIQTHPKMLDETLTVINTSNDVLAALITALKEPYVREYIELAVSPKWTSLDVGAVKFKEYEYHRSMAGAFLINRQTWNIVSSVIMNPLVKESTKEIQFKALSEMLFADESKVLMAVLKKNLSELYPNITFELIIKALNDTI